MSKLPIPSWLNLPEAIVWLVDQGILEADAKSNLPRAFRDDLIQTRGRCKTFSDWHGHRTIQSFYWDQAKVDWESSSFTIPANRGQKHNFTDVDVSLDGLSSWLGEGDSGKNAAVEFPEYTPPYMAFMFRAVAEMELSEENTPLKKTIEAWLTDHWPSELGDISNRAVENMATFLRPPKAQRGGNTRAKKPSKGDTP